MSFPSPIQPTQHHNVTECDICLRVKRCTAYVDGGQVIAICQDCAGEYGLPEPAEPGMQGFAEQVRDMKATLSDPELLAYVATFGGMTLDAARQWLKENIDFRHSKTEPAVCEPTEQQEEGEAA